MKVCIIGSLNIDHILYVQSFTRPGETNRSIGYEKFYGGKGGNQALACAKLGLEVSIVGSINANDEGIQYLHHLEHHGVDTSLVKRSEHHTGLAFIEVDGHGENKIVTHGGANYELSGNWLDENMDSILKHDVFLFSLEIPSESVIKLMKQIRKSGKIIVLDPAPVSNFTDEMIGLVDYITPNETELSTLQASDLPLSSLHLILKKGNQGSWYYHGNSSYQADAYKVDAIDTVGAGDTFNAGICFGIVHSLTPERMLSFANACGAMATMAHGAQGNMPFLKDVKSFIDERKGS